MVSYRVVDLSFMFCDGTTNQHYESHVSYESHNNSRQMLLQILVDVVYLVVIM